VILSVNYIYSLMERLDITKKEPPDYVYS
jgi:hypothetical protein